MTVMTDSPCSETDRMLSTPARPFTAVSIGEPIDIDIIEVATWMGHSGQMALSTYLRTRYIGKLGDDLAIEARAPDGVIEAFRVADAPAFALGLQWHPEWQFAKDSFSSALFAAFGEATRERASAAR